MGDPVSPQFSGRDDHAGGAPGVAAHQPHDTLLVSAASISPSKRRAASALFHGLKRPPRRLSTSLVELQPGGSRTLFLVHDGDGETLLYLNLARHMRRSSDLAVVGIEPLRLPGAPLAHPSIEEMAAYYVSQIRAWQPHGPYLLGGLCAGGVIAFEMTSRLEQAGERVERLLILDSVAPGTPARQSVATARFDRLKQALGDEMTGHSGLVRAGSACSVIIRKVVNTLAWEIANRAGRWSVGARFTLLRLLRARGLPWPRLVPALTVRQIYESADARHVPGCLHDTPVVLVRARTGSGDDQPYREIYADDTLGWGRHAGRVTTIDADGGHSSMLQEPFVQSLAVAMASAASASAGPAIK